MTVTIVVLDSVGVGELADAANFGDAGAHTLDHALLAAPVALPNLQAVGLGNVPGVASIPAALRPQASYGRLSERSLGKDTTTGHWEFMGIVLEHPFQTFTRFPDAVMNAFDAATGRGHLGNVVASGTTIIEELGARHLETAEPIVYTSADSVFQVAAHVDVVPLETLYAWCAAAREILMGEHAVARIIARPFKGEVGAFERIGAARHDYSLAPPQPTVLDALYEAGREVIGIGKIPDIYAHRGFTQEVASASNLDGIERTLAAMAERPNGLVFTNLVEFDSLYGHRRNPVGYTAALADVDAAIPRFLAATGPQDLLMFISDHGNDPTWRGTDHTREHGLLLAYNPRYQGVALGTRSTFADVGATTAAWLDVPWLGVGSSFAASLRAASPQAGGAPASDAPASDVPATDVPASD